jgi:ABC-type sugar transport system substrate-binding protein
MALGAAVLAAGGCWRGEKQKKLEIMLVAKALDKARAAGIPVVIVDTDVRWPYHTSFVGIDNRLGGRIAGEMNAAMAQYPERIGKRAIEEAIKASRGQAVEKRIDIGTALVTKENVAEFLK